MNLTNYINDLLYRYECVIIPDFGGFVTNKINASLDHNSHVFYPPSKKITFNSHLKANDGLLANYIASSENISFEKATKAIGLTVLKWKKELEANVLEIGNVGVLKLNENSQIIFEPNIKQNFLTESFGLSSVEASLINKKEIKVKPIIPLEKNQDKKGVPAFIKYAVTAAIILTLGFTGNTIYKQNNQKKEFANQQEAIEKKIQSATFVISNPLPTIELNANKEKTVTKKYHVIAGAFQFPENAEKKVNQLKKQGYKASVLGINKWGLTEVAFASFDDRNKATNALYKIQDTVSEDAWLLIKK